MKKTLGRQFFDRQVMKVAEEMLGKFLVRKIGKKEISLMIVEVEAYDGLKDKASHASRGKTKRSEVMFGSAGQWYVYFTYGMHWMLNIVTGHKDYPAAVLIRGVDGIKGPGRTTKHFKISKKFNGALANKKTGLYIEDRGIKIKKSWIKKSPRIGVDYAGSIWSKKLYNLRLLP